MKGYTKQLLDMLGIEPNELFALKSTPHSNHVFPEDGTHKYRINENFQLFREGDPGTFRPGKLMAILTGEYEIVKGINLTADDKSAIRYFKRCGFKYITADNLGTFAWRTEPHRNSTQDNWEGTNPTEVGYPLSCVSSSDKGPFYIGDY